MADNLNLASPASGRLDTLAAITLQGPDALAFAQAQFASDVLALATGHWHWSAWLNAKGRVIATLLLWRRGDDELLVVLPDGDAPAVAQALQRYVFRRKLRIALREDLHASGRLALPPQGGSLAAQDGDAVHFDLGVAAQPRTLSLSPLAPPADAADLTAHWRELDLRMGLARLEPGQREQWTPQQIGLDRLAAYSVKKGCYPGQEIVARTHFLGKAKRGLQLLQVGQPVTAGAAVARGGQAIGSVASAAGGLALCVLPLDSPADELVIDGQPALPQPLLDGLAR